MYSVVFMRSLDDDCFYFGSRINCLAAVCLLQAWMMWNFINFHLRRMRERGAASRKLRSPKKTKSKGKAKVMRIQNIHVNVWNQDFYFTYRIFLLLFFFYEKLNLIENTNKFYNSDFIMCKIYMEIIIACTEYCYYTS